MRLDANHQHADMIDLAHSSVVAPPREGTLDRWAYDYVVSDALETKLRPSAPPTTVDEARAAIRIESPGRPAALVPTTGKTKTPGPEALRDPKRRAALLHTFLHHELQAAELMCWAVLAFPETPTAFKRGLIAICRDEVRHMQMYASHIETLGSRVGDFPVRDWFWSRVPQVKSPGAFVAVMGLGFEAANLDHTQRFAERFSAVGDDVGAALQLDVAREEIPHVAFAAHWFRKFEGDLTFERWREALPPPLSPMVMRGDPVDRAARIDAGFSEPFLDDLSRWQPVSRGS